MPTVPSNSIALVRASALLRPAFTRRPSTRVEPTVKQGSSATIGSWPIIATVVPRSRARSFSGSLAKSCPSRLIRSAVVAPGDGTSPRIASAVMVLPQPDSPTRPSTSPRRALRLTRSTTAVSPLGWGKETVRLRTSRIGTSGPSSTVRVEGTEDGATTLVGASAFLGRSAASIDSLRACGSDSRRPVPIWLKASTVRMSAVPIGTISQGRRAMSLVAWSTSCPQSGDWGSKPRPRKDSEVRMRNACERKRKLWTMSGPVTFGKMCRNRMRTVPRPETRAEST